MGGSMAGYRIYRVGKEGRFVGVQEVFAASDTDAMLQAHKLLDGSDLEVWRGDEKIGYLRADGAKSERPDGLAGEGSLPIGIRSEIA
jgi:hypothetical protein